MSEQQISTTTDAYDTIQTVTLGGVQLRLRVYWQSRLDAFFADLSTLDGTEIVTGKRLSPGWSILLGLTPVNDPEGEIFVRGNDGYTFDSLGESLFLTFYSDDELVPTPTDLGFTVVAGAYP